MVSNLDNLGTLSFFLIMIIKEASANKIKAKNI